MRTLNDLITELEQEAASVQAAHVDVGLVIVPIEGVGHTTDMVYANDADKLEKLCRLIEQGGAPIGFLTVSQDADGETSVQARPLAEYASDDDVKQALMTMAATTLANLVPEASN